MISVFRLVNHACEGRSAIVAVCHKHVISSRPRRFVSSRSKHVYKFVASLSRFVKHVCEGRGVFRLFIIHFFCRLCYVIVTFRSKCVGAGRDVIVLLR